MLYIAARYDIIKYVAAATERRQKMPSKKQLTWTKRHVNIYKRCENNAEMFPEN